MTKINYMIAACSSRVTAVTSHNILTKDILHLHLEQLAKTDTSKLSQITILRTLPLIFNGNFAKESNYYWDVANLFSKFACPVVFLDVQNRYFSYSSWITGCLTYGDKFDYHVLIEDDYYPAHKDFVSILLDIHTKKLPNGGYLNSFTTDQPAVSNGFVDTKTFLEGIHAAKPDPYTAISGSAQVSFGVVLFGKKMCDYTDRYRTLFKSNSLIEETHDPNLSFKEDIFNPIEYLYYGEQEFVKSVASFLL